MRQVFFDTETTGFSPTQGDRLVEIACVEAFDCRLSGREFHTYPDPERDMQPEAEALHGLSSAFLPGKPRFAEIATQPQVGHVRLVFCGGTAMRIPPFHWSL